ncbi:unnamed protein product, partial [Porites evermanni]
TCSARDLNSIRGQGCLYLRLKPSQIGGSRGDLSSQPSTQGRQRTGDSRDPGRRWRQSLNQNNQVGAEMGESSDEELARAILPGLGDSFSIGIVGSGDGVDSTIDDGERGGDERPDGTTDRTAHSTPSAADRRDAEEDDTRSNHQSDDEDNVSRERDRDSVDSRSEDGDSDVVPENENGDDESDAIIDADERGDSDDDVVEVTGVASCSSNVNVVTSSKIGFQRDIATVCGNKGTNTDMDILLRVITSPCPLQLHFFNCTKVLTEVALIKTKRPVLVLLWDTHSQGSVRLFTEQAELCKRANTETTIFPVRKTSESFKNCKLLKTLLHRTNIEDALALLLTKVGSEFIVLMNLTSRDNLNNGAVLDKFSNSLNNYQGRYADWEKSENLREIREKQEQLLRESLLSDQKKAQERKQNCDVKVCIRTTRQQRIRDCNDGEGFLIKAKWGGKSNTRLFNRGAKFQEVYDWLGSIRELPLFFSIHRPLATSVISRQEMVRRNEGVFVRDLVSS